jgi:hypothetical protein
MNESMKGWIISAVVMSGCASQGDNWPGRGGGGGGGDDDAPVVEGSYALESSVALPDGYLADGAPLFDDFLGMTDDPNDPATWILDRVEDRLGFFEAKALSAARSAFDLDAIVNGIILEYSPELVTELVQLGGDIAELSSGLEVSSRLVVREDGGRLVADHEVVGLAFAIDGQVAPIDGIALPAAARTVVTVEGEVLRIERHGFALEQGAVLRYGLERVALPRVAPGASSVSGWLADEIDCAGIGERIEDLVEVGSPSDYEDACVDVVEAAVDEVLGDAFAMRAEIAISGRADLTDDDGDGRYDLMDGTWQGTMTVGGAAKPMPASRFEGVRE